MPGNLEIRLPTPADLSGLQTIEKLVFAGDRLSRRSFRYLMQSASALFLIAGEGQEVAGYAIALTRKNTSTARLYSIAVLPQEAGGGLAGTLIAKLENAVRERGCVALVLEVRADNARAIAFYEKRGYRRFALRENYYEDGAAALRYRKQLVGNEKGQGPR